MRTLTVEEHERDCHLVRGAKLRLKGKWLQHAGFVPGQKVTVQTVPGGLLILLLPNEHSKPLRTL